MAFDAAEEAVGVAKAEVRGAELPALVSEKQIKIERAGHVSSLADTEDSTPIEKEIHTLRRVPGRIPWICFTVALVELCERFAYYGVTAVRKSLS